MAEISRQQPTLIVLVGPPAVGKMTVGQQLERITGFRLFHQHQVIDLVSRYFPYNTDPTSPFERLVVSFRRQVFEEAARVGVPMITTQGLRFDLPGDVAAVESYTRPFASVGGRVYIVELAAAITTRIERNLTENRRRHKETDWATEEYLYRDDATHRYDSGGALPFDHPYLRLDTEHLTAAATAERIRAHFDLPHVAAIE